MRRNLTIGSVLAALLLALGIGQGLLEKRADAQAGNGGKVQVPRFEVDPSFPKPLPNHWYQGMSIGVGVDANDHVWIVHRPDLPHYPGDASKHGLGLWNQPALELGIEALLFAGGILLYLRATRARDRIGTYALWALVAVLALAYLGATLGPPPPSAQAVAASSLIVYVMAGWGWWIDRHREAR